MPTHAAEDETAEDVLSALVLGPRQTGTVADGVAHALPGVPVQDRLEISLAEDLALVLDEAGVASPHERVADGGAEPLLATDWLGAVLHPHPRYLVQAGAVEDEL